MAAISTEETPRINPTPAGLGSLEALAAEVGLTPAEIANAEADEVAELFASFEVQVAGRIRIKREIKKLREAQCGASTHGCEQPADDTEPSAEEAAVNLLVQKPPLTHARRDSFGGAGSVCSEAPSVAFSGISIDHTLRDGFSGDRQHLYEDGPNGSDGTSAVNMMTVIELSIGGTIFTATRGVWTRFPDSRLATIISHDVCSPQSGPPVARDASGRIFVERSPRLFP
eukprot:SAG11_NODE_1381_length_5078_cov_8.176341_3_plen_228_part_00